MNYFLFFTFWITLEKIFSTVFHVDSWMPVFQEKASIFDCTEFPSSLHGPSDSKRLANVFLTLFIVTDSGEMLATHLTAQDCYVIPLGTCDLDVVWIGIVGGMGSLTLRPISDNRHIFSHVVLGK